jgi:hypothetical protein
VIESRLRQNTFSNPIDSLDSEMLEMAAYPLLQKMSLIWVVKTDAEAQLFADTVCITLIIVVTFNHPIVTDTFCNFSCMLSQFDLIAADNVGSKFSVAIYVTRSTSTRPSALMDGTNGTSGTYFFFTKKLVSDSAS